MKKSKKNVVGRLSYCCERKGLYCVVAREEDCIAKGNVFWLQKDLVAEIIIL